MARILTVDDSSLARKAMARILAETGHEIIDANNGRRALERIEADAPDCVILDLVMPEINGLEVLSSLKQRGIRIPVIVVTADIQDTTRRQCEELGAACVLNKPPKPELLLAALRQHLGTPAASAL